MSKPIKTTSSKIDAAPTPHNTPSSVLGSSYLKNGNPARSVPNTIKEEDITSALANNPQLLASIQDKLGDLVGQDSGYVSSLPHAVRERIYALKKLQRDLFELEKDFQLEMFALEEKYLQKYDPVHKRRFEIVTGQQEPTAREIEVGKQMGDELGTVAEEPEEEEEEEEESGEDQIKGIPSFWLTAFENLPMVSQTVTSADAEVLECLTDVRLEYLTEGKPGFKLVFHFDDENPFFSNKQLVKTYFYQSELGYSGDFIYDHAEGCEIKWTDNESNVTVSVEKRKQRNKNTKQVRTIEKITPVESFFNFFDPPKVPAKTDKSHSSGGRGDDDNEDEDEGDENEDEEEDAEEVAELESRLALDYAIGEEFKDKLVPRAVDWFTGAAIEFEYDADELDDDDEAEFDSDLDEDDDDDDEDNDSEDDGDSEEDSEPSDFKPAASNSKEQPPECKQA
ncbi:LAME_0G05600g1_1 [Lachancea meyersii CBS 8951]|uniref:LAME_0G05600g1_1 n=1 Tax=Lachancea meyersii CBS 8951 TaxID=1266667 RepID=A0A1G4K798_9SACH|nr:LAME_0G05600g1_1 [Lachancea meyersii CBS 8951]